MSFYNNQRIGSYRLLRKLGEGGMGSVFEAEHISIARRVAIKVLNPSCARDSQALARFFNEAKAVNLIDHPGLVQILDYGDQEDCGAYLVMELLKGETLRSRLKLKSGGLPVPEVLHISRQLAAALSAAHSRGIVHRDLKPENAMLVPDPEAAGGERVKLLDFGIAKLAQGTEAAGVLTQTSAVIGTPAYMSPEQCRGASLVDDRADVYSLGVVMYELLVGRRPFLGTSQGELMGQHLFLDPPCVNEAVRGVPAALVSLVATMLRKDREQRPRMTEVVLQVEQIGESCGLPGRRSGLRERPIAQVSGTSQGAAQEIVSLQSVDLLSLDSAKPLTAGSGRIRNGLLAMRPSARVVLVAGLSSLLALAVYSHGRQHEPLGELPQPLASPAPPLDPRSDGQSATAMVAPTPPPPLGARDDNLPPIRERSVSLPSPAYPSARQQVTAGLSRPLRTQQKKAQAKAKVLTHEVLED